jgi:DmsE family decaheme c-type cytochrome
VLLYGALFAFVQPLKAEESKFSDGAISSLADFAKGMVVSSSALAAGPAETKDRGIGEKTRSDVAYSELVSFVQQLGAQEPAVIKVAAKPAAAAKSPKSTAPGEATYVGSQVCMGCHAGGPGGNQAEAFSHTKMGMLQKQGKIQCETCHGPGSAHAKAGGGRGVGGIISFRKEDTSRTAEENNAICLGCHERGDRTYWNGSTHETRGLACTNCHTVMKNVSRKHQMKTAFEPETCFQCHKDRRAQMFRSSHMPLREGKIVCSDCHNPHGSFTEALLRENSINDNCYKCHAEKRGPFLFEHTPVRENCVACHDPHGSVNEYLLKTSRPRLCAQCHTIDHGPGIASGPTAVYSFSRACNNCHTEVHGTNSPSGALLHR